MARKSSSSVRTKKGGDNKITLSFDATIVTPDVFKRAINAFIELLKSVSDETTGSGKKIQWNMSVAKGSNNVIARPVADVLTARASSLVIQAIPQGIRRLQKGTTTAPAYFDTDALQAAKELAEIISSGRNKPSYIRIQSTGTPCEIEERTVASVDRLLGGQHQALGTIEGKLQTISNRGQLQFVVFDSLYDKGVNCFVEDEMVDQAVQGFGKRVAVSGMIQYDKEGRPVSIRVDSVHIFKAESELPSIDEMHGIFKKNA